MKIHFVLGLLLPAFLVHAEIYRGIDPEGNVFYSDTEQENSELIPTPTPNTIIMPKLEAEKPEITEKKEENRYEAFSIISPANDATVKDNSGNLSISLLIKPKLDIKQGDIIRLSIDNQVVTKKTTTLNNTITFVDRGTHTLKAELLDHSGKKLMSSSVQFHMKRFSVLH
jgi:hypothetical protein